MHCNLENHYDVTIVGAGPSGSVLAYELVKRGVKVLILEKAKLPRGKVCAGGITVRASSLLPFKFDDVVENVIYGTRLSRNLIAKKVRRYNSPLAYTVMREKFDRLLSDQACKAGAAIEDGIEVKQIELERDRVLIKTSYGTFFSPFLVGADGANSTVVRSLHLRGGFHYGLAINGHMEVTSETFQKWDGLIGLDYGVGDGFSWVFPKKNCVSVGAGGSFRTAKRLKPYVLRLVQSYKLGTAANSDFLKGHLMSIRKPGMPICHKRVLLVGDAAGLIDPLTGEGIYYGLKSAHLAVDYIMKALSGESEDFKEYEKAVDTEIMPELKAARTIQRMNRITPTFFFNLLKDNDRVWNAFCRLLRGEKTYVSLKYALIPPLRLLFKLF